MQFDQMKANFKQALTNKARAKFDSLTTAEQNYLVVESFIKLAAKAPVYEETFDEVEKYATKEQAQKMGIAVVHRVLARGESYAWEQDLAGIGGTYSS